MKIEKPGVPQIVAEQIKSKIESRALTIKLPGQQKLADQYGVSVPSIIGALKILEKEGYIAPAEPGKKRTNHQSHTTKSLGINLLVLTPPNRSLTQSNLLLLESAKNAWTEKFEGSSCIHLSRIHRPLKLDELKVEIKQQNIRALLVFEPTMLWIETLQNVSLPIYRFGGTRFEAQLGNSGFGHNIEDIITEGIEKLASQGHRKILTPLTRSYLVKPTTNVYRRSLRSSGIDAEAFCPIFPINDAEQIPAFWSNQLRKLQPTAVLSIHLPVFFSLVGFCNVAKLRIPENISVVSLMNHEMLDFFQPEIVAPTKRHYHRLTLFQKWLDSDFKEQGFTSLSLDLQDGDSIQKIQP